MSDHTPLPTQIRSTQPGFPAERLVELARSDIRSLSAPSNGPAEVQLEDGRSGTYIRHEAPDGRGHLWSIRP